uniref:Uncharacterized protein n=1 Tax=Chromera velia CCMP2878 TaxID=1169474 RepID=A0A0K6S9Q9_9ALVE|eukprot:Cvel_8262.t1-p1 / transcript=Cvel_8262.t1 / gene=Cvel_8262 / organism=Chromera_velia_CCMP2878 / gene_product=hypothetical protein / transcript_product=hypothetical protein / location=Cvel_scaffold452:56798-57928(+) / protein_length=315 / sequence_SO=supercontig / SO=protein_coding / is_pseudo=false
MDANLLTKLTITSKVLQKVSGDANFNLLSPAEKDKKLMHLCANLLNKNIEFSGQQVALFLLRNMHGYEGYNLDSDCYKTDSYPVINVKNFMYYLDTERQQWAAAPDTYQPIASHPRLFESPPQNGNTTEQRGHKPFEVHAPDNPNARILCLNPVIDYMMRGANLDRYSVYRLTHLYTEASFTSWHLPKDWKDYIEGGPQPREMPPAPAREHHRDHESDSNADTQSNASDLPAAASNENRDERMEDSVSDLHSDDGAEGTEGANEAQIPPIFLLDKFIHSAFSRYKRGHPLTGRNVLLIHSGAKTRIPTPVGVYPP